jgi:hypothetical protein
MRLAEPHPFVLPEWQRVSWEVYRTGDLCVVAFSDVAVAALQRDDRGVVRFLGGEDVTDYPGPAVAAGHGADAARGLVGHLRAASGWTELDVRDARPGDGFADALEVAAARAGLRTESGPDEPVARLDLPASWDAYLQRLTLTTGTSCGASAGGWGRPACGPPTH